MAGINIIRGIWGKMINPYLWKKYPWQFIVFLLLLLGKVIFSYMESQVQQLTRELKDCQEAAKADLRERSIYDRVRAEKERERIDRYIDQSIQDNTDRILRPKIDSIKKL